MQLILSTSSYGHADLRFLDLQLILAKRRSDEDSWTCFMTLGKCLDFF